MTELSKRDRELLAQIVGGCQPFTFQADGRRLERGGYIERGYVRPTWDERDRIVYMPTAKGIEAVAGEANDNV